MVWFKEKLILWKDSERSPWLIGFRKMPVVDWWYGMDQTVVSWYSKKYCIVGGFIIRSY